MPSCHTVSLVRGYGIQAQQRRVFLNNMVLVDYFMIIFVNPKNFRDHFILLFLFFAVGVPFSGGGTKMYLFWCLVVILYLLGGVTESRQSRERTILIFHNHYFFGKNFEQAFRLQLTEPVPLSITHRFILQQPILKSGLVSESPLLSVSLKV